MRWFEPFPDRYRTGATFVHDWTAIATWVVVTGHILFALNDRRVAAGDAHRPGARRVGRRPPPRWAAGCRAGNRRRRPVSVSRGTSP